MDQSKDKIDRALARIDEAMATDEPIERRTWMKHLVDLYEGRYPNFGSDMPQRALIQTIINETLRCVCGGHMLPTLMTEDEKLARGGFLIWPHAGLDGLDE